jgi:hypothetical protein
MDSLLEPAALQLTNRLLLTNRDSALNLTLSAMVELLQLEMASAQKTRREDLATLSKQLVAM